MLRLEKVATPATAATVVPPERMPAPGLVPITIVTVLVKSVAMLPWASRAVTRTAGVIGAPAGVLLGCAVKTSSLAAAATMLRVVLVAPPSPVALGAGGWAR